MGGAGGFYAAKDYLVSRSDFWVGQGASMPPWIIWSVGLTSGWGRVLLGPHGLPGQ